DSVHSALPFYGVLASKFLRRKFGPYPHGPVARLGARRHVSRRAPLTMSQPTPPVARPGASPRCRLPRFAESRDATLAVSPQPGPNPASGAVKMSNVRA